MRELRFKVAELPPNLNGIKKLVRSYKYGQERDRWQLLIRSAIGPDMVSFPSRVSIQFDVYCVQRSDKDNAQARFKLVGDALVNMGIIRDDSPRIIDEDLSHYVENRISHRPEKRIEVLIKDLDEHPEKRGGSLYCDYCGVEIDRSKPYRLSHRTGRARCTRCYMVVNAELKRQGLGPASMTLVEPKDLEVPA